MLHNILLSYKSLEVTSGGIPLSDGSLSLCRGWKIAMDIASALVFLHTKGLVHLDIKSLNILLGQGRKEAKLADLGLARLVKEGNLDLQHTLPGTPAYSAPEVMRAQIQWRLRNQGQQGLFSTEVSIQHERLSHLPKSELCMKFVYLALMSIAKILKQTCVSVLLP